MDSLLSVGIKHLQIQCSTSSYSCRLCKLNISVVKYNNN